MLIGRLLVVLATTATMLVVAGCGSESGGGSEGSSAAGFPKTIEHKHGSTEIPAPPERVVSAGFTEQDILLALGVTPVGTREFTGGYDYRERPWAQEALGGEEIETVGAEELNFERVAERRPDLIVGLNSGMTEREYETLSRIAPTIAQSDEFIDFGVPWQEQTRAIGEALGRSEQARELVADVEEQFAAAREDNPELEGKTAVLGYGSRGGSFGAYASQDFRVRFFADLGLETPTRVDELAGEEFFVDFSEEQIGLLEADLLVMFAAEEEVMDNPLYRRLDAVREGRVIYLDLEDQLAGALGFGSPLSLPFAIDGFVPRIVDAVDGDRATEVEEPR